MNNFCISMLVVLLGVAVTTISAGGGGKDEAQYLGKFETGDLSGEDFNEVLKCMEYKDEDREKVRKTKFTIEFKMNPKNNTKSVIFTYPPSSSTFKNRVINFESGKEFDEKLCDGRVVKTTITCQPPAGFIKEQKFDGGLAAKWVAVFSADDVTVNISCKDKTAVLKHKRVKT